MAKYVVTFSKRGVKRAMAIEAVSESNARDIAVFFENTNGRLITKGKDAPKLA